MFARAASVSSLLCSSDMQDANTTIDVLLNHVAIAGDQQVICKMLMVSKEWRAAVQRSAAGLTSAYVTLKASGDQEQNALASFTAWLPEHCGMVGSIDVTRTTGYTVPVTAASQLSRCLQSIDGGTWQLRSFRFNSAQVDNGLLLALPASTLTALDCYAFCNDSPPIARFIKLQSLALWEIDPVIAASTLAQLAAHTALTGLTILGLSCSSEVTSLPGQLQELSLEYDVGHPTISLEHLTVLRQLQLESGKPVAVSLPLQLKDLIVESQDGDNFALMHGYGISNLQQLQYLYLHSPVECEPLQLLSTLTELDHLVCFVSSKGVTQSDASVWGQLPKLRQLEFNTYVDTRLDLGKVVTGIASATSLTALDIGFDMWEYSSLGIIGVESIYKQLARLTQLCRLTVDVDATPYPDTQNGVLWPDVADFWDLGYLSSLTGLSGLALVGVCHYATATDMSQLLSCLTGLSSLYVTSPYPVVWRLDLLPVIGQLQQLTYLGWKLGGDLDLPTRDIMDCLRHLSGLKRLSEISWFTVTAPEVLDEFWAMIRE